MSLLLTTHTWSLLEILLINCGAAHTDSPQPYHQQCCLLPTAQDSQLSWQAAALWQPGPFQVSVFSKGYNWTLFQDHTDRFFAVCWNFWKCAFLFQNRRTLPLIQPPNHNAHGMDMLASACLCSTPFLLLLPPRPLPKLYVLNWHHWAPSPAEGWREITDAQQRREWKRKRKGGQLLNNNATPTPTPPQISLLCYIGKAK